MRHRPVLLSALVVLLAAAAHAQNKRDLAVREDKQKLANDDSWFYDDLDTARVAAAKTKRPLMIVFR
jgi:hypothetical protein